MAGAIVLALHVYRAPGPLGQAADVVVPRGHTAAIAAALAEADVVAHPLALRLAARLTGPAPLHAGEYAIPAHASLAEVLAILRTARPVQHRLTIPEGLTAAEIARLLDAAAALDGADPLPPEAGVLPQTYDYLRGTSRAALLARATAARDAALAAAWSARTPAAALPDPAAALTLASIVERETARPDERPHIAAVFLNRLHLGMKLQSDPTAAYAAAGGLGALDRPLSRADLAFDNPYNTYVHAGLPPGPICAPSLASIQAVLRPAISADLYFVADGSGGHAFAATLADHDRNVARWRALH